MNSKRVRSVVSKILLGFAYPIVILQWLWLFIVGLPPLLSSGAIESFISPASNQTPVIQSPQIEMTPLVLWIVIAITIVILMTTVIILIRLPQTILTKSDRVVVQVAQTVVPVVTHHKQLPAKTRLAVTRRVRLLIQLAVALIPGVASLFLLPVDTLTHEIIMTIGVLLMASSVAMFILAWLIEPITATSRTQSHASRG